ncbi:EamA family transporter [Bacillus tianshenii]|nr:EamA family transporter [Bacillus tianshenii]
MNRDTLLIALGAILWGIIGIFVQGLLTYGFTPLEITALRVVSASLLILCYLLVKNKQKLKIHWQDTRYFIGTGILSIVFFNWCLFTAMRETSIAVASILLYTAPAFVTVLSRFFFKEWLTPRKITALLVTFIGCAFVIGVAPYGVSSISTAGLLAGLGAGFGYALYSIFGKFALAKYDSYTVTAFTFFTAAVFLLPLTQLWTKANTLADPLVWVYVLGLGLFSTVLAFLLYTTGLSRIESSRASIVATIEPVTAALVSVIIFQEQLNLWQVAGIGMVLSAVILVQERKRRSL